MPLDGGGATSPPWYVFVTRARRATGATGAASGASRLRVGWRCTSNGGGCGGEAVLGATLPAGSAHGHACAKRGGRCRMLLATGVARQSWAQCEQHQLWCMPSQQYVNFVLVRSYPLQTPCLEAASCKLE